MSEKNSEYLLENISSSAPLTHVVPPSRVVISRLQSCKRCTPTVTEGRHFGLVPFRQENDLAVFSQTIDDSASSRQESTRNLLEDPEEMFQVFHGKSSENWQEWGSALLLETSYEHIADAINRDWVGRRSNPSASTKT